MVYKSRALACHAVSAVSCRTVTRVRVYVIAHRSPTADAQSKVGRIFDPATKGNVESTRDKGGGRHQHHLVCSKAILPLVVLPPPRRAAASSKRCHHLVALPSLHSAAASSTDCRLFVSLPLLKALPPLRHVAASSRRCRVFLASLPHTAASSSALRLLPLPYAASLLTDYSSSISSQYPRTAASSPPPPPRE